MEQRNCKTCGKCSNVSNRGYDFDENNAVGVPVEDQIASCLEKMGATVEKQAPGYLPDFLVSMPGKKPFYLEIKAINRAFMSIGSICPESGLEPWETVVVNHNALKRYIELGRAKNRVYVLFCITDRPCLGQGVVMFIAKIKTLAAVYDRQGMKNYFLREYNADVSKRCCPAKYHFSIQDMKQVRFPS